MRLVYEHLLFPGIFLQEPSYLVFIRQDTVDLGVYGFDFCTMRELEIAILCRACEAMECSMVNTALHRCIGVVKTSAESEDQVIFVYNDKKFIYEKQK